MKKATRCYLESILQLMIKIIDMLFTGRRLCRRALKLDDPRIYVLEASILEPQCPAACGSLWRPVAARGTGVLAFSLVVRQPVAACGGLWRPVGPESWPVAWVSGSLWQRPVAACGTGVPVWSLDVRQPVAAWGALWQPVGWESWPYSKNYILEASSPGGLEPAGLEAWSETGSLDVAVMMRLRKRMLMNDVKDED